MPTRILYAVNISTGKKYRLMTLHPDGSLTADSDDTAYAIRVYQNKHKLSNEFIFEMTKRKYNAYTRHVEETIDD